MLKSLRKEEILVGVTVAIIGYAVIELFFGKKEDKKPKEDYKPFRLTNPGIELNKKISDEELTSRFKTIAGSDYDSYIESIKQIPLEPIIAIRQLFQESSFSPSVINCSRVSSAGARGIAQFMPKTWPSYSTGNPCNVSDSLKAHAKLMKALMSKYPERPDLALAGYNSGPYIKDNQGKYIYKKAFENKTPFRELKGIIPNETYKYSSSILRP
jgi:soluble lytic murein transglycosylase-like protein